jgi:hypothetical protein
MLPASADSVSVTVNEQKQNYSTDTVYANDNVMIPLRDMAESLNYIVEWNGEKQCVDLIKIDTTITVYINSDVYEVNGVSHTLPAKTVIYGTKTYAPLSFFKAIAPMDTIWDYNKMALTIDSDAFPQKEGIFAPAPVDPADMKESIKWDFESTDGFVKTELGTFDSANSPVKSIYGTGFYSGRDCLKNIDGENVFSCHYWKVKVKDFFKDFNAKKYRVRFKMKLDPTNTIETTSASGISMTIHDTGRAAESGGSGNVLTKYNFAKLLGMNDWVTYEFVLDYSDRSAIKTVDGMDRDSLSFNFYTEGTSGTRVLIDDFEVSYIY